MAVQMRGTAVGAQGGEQDLVIVAFHRSAADIVDLDARGAQMFEIQAGGDLFGHIDQTVIMIGTAIIDAGDDRAAVQRIGHAHIAGQRHRRMRHRNRFPVEHFAIGGHAAMERRAIPGGRSDCAVILVLARHIELAGYGIGLAHHVIAAAFGNRLAVGNDFRAGFDAVFVARGGLGRRCSTIGDQQAQHDHRCRPKPARRGPAPDRLAGRENLSGKRVDWAVRVLGQIKILENTDRAQLIQCGTKGTYHVFYSLMGACLPHGRVLFFCLCLPKP